MPSLYLELTSDEVHEQIPYSMICMTRYGSRWDTMHRRRRWTKEFTEAEREAARRIFSRSHDWTLGRGVPNNVMMSVGTYRLWQKLGDFCASI